MISLALPDGTLLYVNPAYARHFGKQPDQMIGVNLYDFVGPQDREPVRQLLARVMASGHSVHSENRMRAADGSELWVAWTNGVQIDGRQQRLLHSVGRDVTQRKLAELALRASQAFLERTGRVAGVGGWELEIANGQITWSDQTRRIYGVDAHYQPTLAAAIDFFAPQARPIIKAAVQRGITRGEPWDLQLPLITAAGRQIWVRAVGEAEFEQGQAVRLLGAIQDITEQRRLEQRLSDSECFLHQLTDSLPLRIAYVDDQRRYRFVNQALLQHFGRERDQVLGRTRAELRPGDNDELFGQRARAALAGQAQSFEFEETVDGALRRFENRLVPDRDDAGRVRGFFVTGIDITERNAAERALRELVTIFDNTTDFVVQTDWRGQINYMNPSARRAVGLQADEPVAQRNFAEFNTATTNRLFAQTIVPAVKAGTVWVGETSLNLAGRSAVPMSHMVIAHRDALGRVDRYSSVIRDISAEVQAQRDVQRQTATLHSVTEAIPATVAVVGSDGAYRFVNGAFERWCGLPRDHILARQASDVLGAAEFARQSPWMLRALAGEAVDFTLAYATPDGVTHRGLSYVPLRLASGATDGFVVVTQDITAQKREEARLLQLAQRDPLTGLLNRAGFESGLAPLQQPGGPVGLAVLYIDLDNFKPVNDSHGHPAGDQVLQLFARRLSALVRPSDLVARLGGDEFAIVLAGLREPVNAQTVADKVLAAARTPFQVGPLQLTLSASIGVAYSNAPNPAWRELLVQADAHLLQAKAGGKGRRAG